MSIDRNRNVYVGHRYVPLIIGEWDKQQTYEGLTVVTYQGASYTSKKRVPAGIDILNEEYWVVTGNYNAQVETYRKEVTEMRSEVDKKADKSEFQPINEHISKNVLFNNVNYYGPSSTDIINGIQNIDDGDILTFPHGDYIIDKEIIIDKSVTLQGVNANLRFENGGKLTIAHSDVSVKGFVLDGQYNDLEHLIKINKNLDNVSVTGNVFKNVSSVTKNTSYFIEVHAINITNLKINDNEFRDITNLSQKVGVGDFAGFIFFRTQSGDSSSPLIKNRNVEIFNNYMENCRTLFPDTYTLSEKIASRDGDAIRLYSPFGVDNENFIIENNKVVNSQKRIVKITQFNNIVVKNIDCLADIYNLYDTSNIYMSAISQVESSKGIVFDGIRVEGYINSGFETPNSSDISITNIELKALKPYDTMFITSFPTESSFTNITIKNIGGFATMLGKNIHVDNVFMDRCKLFINLRQVENTTISNIILKVDHLLYQNNFGNYSRTINITENMGVNVLLKNIDVIPLSLPEGEVSLFSIYITGSGEYNHLTIDNVSLQKTEKLGGIGVVNPISNLIIKNSLVTLINITNGNNIEILNTITLRENVISGTNISDGSKILYAVEEEIVDDGSGV